MSYDNFQQNIEKKISKYKQKVGENYYTYYYYQGLDLLDKYIFNLANDDKTRNSERVSSLMRKANKLQENKYIYKNYILALIIDDDKTVLDEILSLNRNIYENEDILDEDRAIYFFIEGFLDPKVFKDKFKKAKFNNVFFDLDYIDYRILYVLYKKYDIDVFGRGDLYLELSYENINCSRKTLKSRLAIYSIIQDKNQISYYLSSILNDIEYLDKIKNKDFHRLFIEEICDKFDKKEDIKFLSEDMNYKNMKIYEYLFSLLDKDLYDEHQEFFNYIISKYCNYIRFNLNNNDNILENLIYFNREECILAYYNNNSDGYLEYIKRKNDNKTKSDKKHLEKDINLIIKKLKENTQFTEAEYLFMKNCNDKYLEVISKCLCKVELLDMKKVKCKIIFKFENYSEGCLMEYRDDLYYYIPENVIELVVIKDDRIIYGKNFRVTRVFDEIEEYKSKNFEEIYEKYINYIVDNLTNYICKNSFEFKKGIKTNNLSYKFSLYILFGYLDKFIEVIERNGLCINQDIIESIIYTKSLFKDQYENILEKIRFNLKKDRISNSNLIKIISEELGDYVEKQKDIYDKIKEIKDKLKNINDEEIKDSLNEIMEDILEIDRNNSSIQYPVFTDTVGIAYDRKYYDNLRFIKLCEKFIYDNKLVNSVIYDYMKSCYKKTYFLTDKTESVLKFINLYHDKGENTKDNLQMSLNYWIKINQCDDKFINTFKRLCNILGKEEYPKNEVVKKSIDFMLNIKNRDKLIDDLNIANMMENVYSKNTNYYKCLETFLYIYIKNAKLDKVKAYSKDIALYYIKSELITDYSMIIMSTIYKNKYYEDFGKAYINKFKDYFIESLKYEIFDCKKYNQFINFDDNNCIKTSKGEPIIGLEKDSNLQTTLINVGYDDEYKVNENFIKRTIIKENEDVFINEFSYSRDLEFKKKAISICKEKNIYNKNIVEYLLENKQFIKDEDEYKKLYMSYIDNEIEINKSNCKSIFVGFIKKCTFVEDDSRYIENTIIKINQKIEDVNFEFDAFKYINQNLEVIKFSANYVRHIVEKYKDEDKNIYFVEYFSKNTARLVEDEILSSFVYSFNRINIKDSNIVKNLFEIILYAIKLPYGSIVQKTILNNIVDTILISDFCKEFRQKNNKYNNAILAKAISIILEVNANYSYRDHDIYIKVLEYYPNLADNESNIKQLNEFLFIKFDGNLNQLNRLCKSILENTRIYPFTIENQKLINKKAIELFDKEVQLDEFNKNNRKQEIVEDYLGILRELKSINLNDNYYKKFIKIKKEFINGIAIIQKNIFESDLINLYEGFEIDKIDQILDVMCIKDNSLYRIFKNYFNTENLSDLYFKDQDGGFEYNTIILKSSTQLNLDISIEEMIDLFIDYIQLNNYLLNEGFYLPNMKIIEKIDLVNGKIIIPDIYDVKKVNLLEDENLVKNISKEKINNIIEKLIYTVGKSKLDKKDVYLSKIKNDLSSSEIVHLNELVYKLKSIKNDITESKNLKIDKSNIPVGIKAYYSGLLNQEQVKQLVDVIVQSRRAGDKEYIIVYENINYYQIGVNEEVYKYLIRNFKNYGQGIKGLAKEVLSYFKNLIQSSSLKNEDIKDFKIFITYLNEKNVLSKKDLQKYIQKLDYIEQ